MTQSGLPVPCLIHTCDMTPSLVWCWRVNDRTHGGLPVPWLIAHMTWLIPRVAWLISLCGAPMTGRKVDCLCHDSFTCVTWLNPCVTTHSFAWRWCAHDRTQSGLPVPWLETNPQLWLATQYTVTTATHAHVYMKQGARHFLVNTSESRSGRQIEKFPKTHKVCWNPRT